ncbi:MAG: hypothetical protein OEW73_08745 [Gammaproteobacteria bacterium]|nr:hypothetical protein [Gammaproteobacteria bacterium]MDH5240855.1 hypothetical protein [Gammaproteobacteria bacterium]MDH5259814.1 hypothetical protein [Gammaproteobacteria bacterium]MDH5582637.1 hypothetical protein [Gammaproteobacteria bacterium]
MTEILVNSRLQMLLCGVALCTSMSATAEPEPEETLPEMEFLEYLGMWETSDEDWLLLDEKEVARTDRRSDPAPKSEESTEAEDET